MSGTDRKAVESQTRSLKRERLHVVEPVVTKILSRNAGEK